MMVPAAWVLIARRTLGVVGTGIALAPESVLETVQHAAVTRHALPKVHSDVVTPLIWRPSEQSPALLALRDLLVRQRSTAKPAKRIAAR